MQNLKSRDIMPHFDAKCKVLVLLKSNISYTLIQIILDVHNLFYSILTDEQKTGLIV